MISHRRGLRRRPGRGRQARRRDGGRPGGRVRDLHREGRLAARPRPPRRAGRRCSTRAPSSTGTMESAQPRRFRPRSGCRPASTPSTASRWRKRRRASWAAATSRTRWAPASSPPGPASRTWPAPCRRRPAGTTRSEEAMRFGRRTAAILRAFNLRCGIGPELEYPSARYGSQPVDGPAKEQTSGKHWEQHARRLVRDGGLRPQDRQAQARDAPQRSASTGSPRTAVEGGEAQRRASVQPGGQRDGRPSRSRPG